MASSAVNTLNPEPQPAYGSSEGWYSLLERVSSRSLLTEEVLELAARGRRADGDSRWALPVAMSNWFEARYPEALATSLNHRLLRLQMLWLSQSRRDGRSQGRWEN